MTPTDLIKKVEGLTAAQRRILSNIGAGRDPYEGFRDGRAARAGLTGPLAGMQRQGIVDSTYLPKLTEFGLAVLRSLEARDKGDG